MSYFEKRIFLESKPAFSENTGSGHLYLVRREVEVIDDGSIVNTYQPADLVIRGGKSSFGDPLLIQTGRLGESDDRYDITGDEALDETPGDRRSIDVTGIILSGGKFASVSSAWSA